MQTFMDVYISSLHSLYPASFVILGFSDHSPTYDGYVTSRMLFYLCPVHNEFLCVRVQFFAV